MAAIYYQGQCGGLGGGYFDDAEDAAGDTIFHSRVIAVRVRHGAGIDAIQTVIQRKDTGQILDLPVHGGTGGALDQINLGPDQFISRITGWYGVYVDSMTITLMDSAGREDIRGPFGGNGGTNYYVFYAPNIAEQRDISIVGFWGSSGALVDAIGVMLARPR